MDAGKIAQTPASISANADSRNAGAKIAASVKKAIEEEGSAVKKPQFGKKKVSVEVVECQRKLCRQPGEGPKADVAVMEDKSVQMPSQIKDHSSYGYSQSQVVNLSLTQESIQNSCDNCSSLKVKLNRENAQKIKAAREAFAAQERLQESLSNSQTMMQTLLNTLSKNQQECEQLRKINGNLVAELNELKIRFQEIKSTMDKIKFLK